SSVVDSIAWPLALVAAVAFLRKDLVEAISRIQSIKHKKLRSISVTESKKQVRKLKHPCQIQSLPRQKNSPGEWNWLNSLLEGQCLSHGVKWKRPWKTWEHVMESQLAK